VSSGNTLSKKKKKYTFYYDEGKTMSIYNNKE